MNNKEVAVIGMACKFPKSNDVDEFWDNLCSGKDCITRVNSEKDENAVKAFGAIEKPYIFDNVFFNVSNSDAQCIAPQQRLAMQLAYCAIEDAGYNAFDNDSVMGIVCGEAENEYHYERLKYLEKHEPELMMAERLNTGASVTSRIAFKFNLKGPCMTLDTACSTSLSAVHIACNMLRCGDADMMLAGGVCILLNQKSYNSFENVMSSDGYTRAYDQKGTGFVPGNGGGMVVLKLLEDAVRDGDHIYAVVKGSAMNNDGSGKIGYTAPAAQGHIDLINKALKNSGVSVGQIDYLEGHGTATVLGDAVEIRAFKKVFKDVKNKNIEIGSLKSNFGHLNSAAGIASFIKASLSLDKKELPPSIHVEEVNNEFGTRSCLKVLTEYKKLEKRDEKYAVGVSSIGIGGSNAHVVLEEFKNNFIQNEKSKFSLILLSNNNEDNLNKYANEITSYFDKHDVDIQSAAYTLACRRKHFDKRKFMVYKNKKCIYKSSMFNLNNSSSHETVMLFAGTGAYYDELGMELCKVNSEFKKYYDYCIESFSNQYPQIDVINGTEEELECVKVAAAEYALAKYLIDIGVKPGLLVGYSMGEYIAAAVAEIMNIDDVLSIVYKRAKIINKIQNSKMLLAACSPEKFEGIVGDGIYIAGYNAHDRCLVVCRLSEYDKFKAYVDENSIFCQDLSIKSPAHSRELEVVRDEVAELFNIEFKPSKYPIASTFYGSVVDENALSNKEYWIEQMMNPVRFTDAVADVYRKDSRFKYFVHIGADAGLTNYVRRDYLQSCDVIEFLSLDKEESRFLEGIGKLWSVGIDFSINSVFEERTHNVVHLPPYVFEEKYFNIIDSYHQNTEGDESDKTADEDQKCDIEESPADYISDNVIDIIRNVTGVENINYDDEVAALGIDSLAVLIIQTKLQSVFNCELSIKDLYACNRVSDLISLIKSCHAAEDEIADEEETDDEIKDLSELFNLMN